MCLNSTATGGVCSGTDLSNLIMVTQCDFCKSSILQKIECTSEGGPSEQRENSRHENVGATSMKDAFDIKEYVDMTQGISGTESYPRI